jgi:hypothetical protein
MVILTFPDATAERRAHGFLAGRFSFKSWASGKLMVPEQALACLALEGISFVVHGPATYEQLTATLRDPPAATVQ